MGARSLRSLQGGGRGIAEACTRAVYDECVLRRERAEQSCFWSNEPQDVWQPRFYNLKCGRSVSESRICVTCIVIR